MDSGGSASAILTAGATREAAADENAPDPVAVPDQQDPGTPLRAGPDAAITDCFAEPVREHALTCLGRPVGLLLAGLQEPAAGIGLDDLARDGIDLDITRIDNAHPQFRDLDGALVLGDLRTVPLPPRSFDIVYCSLLLHRISNVTLTLDRMVASLRPGGLLLLRIRDRDCAAGLADRILPGPSRRRLHHGLYPGRPGPFPPVYEAASSAAGIAGYLVNRGLVLSRRRAIRTLPDQPGRLRRLAGIGYRVIALATRGRFGDAHDEVLFVVRKPEDRFARVV